MIATAYNRPDEIMYMELPNGLADVWLRKNIAEAVDDEGAACWEYDEAYIRTAMSRKDVEAAFDEIFAGAGAAEKPMLTVDERVSDLEAQVEEQAGAIEELAFIVAGGE